MTRPAAIELTGLDRIGEYLGHNPWMGPMLASLFLGWMLAAEEWSLN